MDIQELATLYREGMSTTHLAKLCDCSHYAIADRLRRAGVELRPRGKGEKRFAKIAESKRLRENPTEIVRLYERGESIATLGVMCRKSKEWVRALLVEYGVEIRQGGTIR